MWEKSNRKGDEESVTSGDEKDRVWGEEPTSHEAGQTSFSWFHHCHSRPTNGRYVLKEQEPFFTLQKDLPRALPLRK